MGRLHENERVPSSMEFWKATHLRKDGSYMEKTNTREFMDMAKKMVDETMTNSSEKSNALVEEEVFNELMYDKDKSYKHVVGYGYGVSHSQVIGLKVELRNSSNRDDSYGNELSRDAIREELEVVKKESGQLKDTCATLVSHFSHITATLSKHGIVVNLPVETPSTKTIQCDDNMGNGHIL